MGGRRVGGEELMADPDASSQPKATESTGWLTPDRRSTLRRLANYAGIAVLVAIVLPFLLYAIPQLIGAEYSYVVLSGSMQPVLAPGDVTFVDEVQPSAIEKGDVINFKRATDERTTTHRVIEVVQRDGAPAFRTQGDANEDPDQGIVSPAELRGRMMTIGGIAVAVPLIGHLIQFTSTQLGFALLFIVPVTLLVINEIWGVLRAAMATDEQSEPPDVGEAEPEQRPSTTGSSSAVPADDEDAGGGISFHPAELRLGAAVLVAFVAYSAWMAIQDPSPLRIGVAGSATVAFALVGGLYLLGSKTARERPSRSEGVVIQEGTMPQEGTVEARTAVPSLDALVELAATTEEPVRRDTKTGTYHLVIDGTLYAHAPGLLAVDAPADQPSAEGDHSKGGPDDGVATGAGEPSDVITGADDD